MVRKYPVTVYAIQHKTNTVFLLIQHVYERNVTKKDRKANTRSWAKPIQEDLKQQSKVRPTMTLYAVYKLHERPKW
jgi:hypothetical protein